MVSIFIDKDQMPNETDLASGIGETYKFWQEIADYTRKVYPDYIEEWNYSSPKYGWSFRIKDKKRVLIYLLPRDRFFKVATVFGQKATESILDSDISADIKQELKNAKAYAEGRGIRIDVKDATLVEDVKKLISIKIEH